MLTPPPLRIVPTIDRGYPVVLRRRTGSTVTDDDIDDMREVKVDLTRATVPEDDVRPRRLISS